MFLINYVDAFCSRRNVGGLGNTHGCGRGRGSGSGCSGPGGGGRG